MDRYSSPHHGPSGAGRTGLSMAENLAICRRCRPPLCRILPWWRSSKICTVQATPSMPSHMGHASIDWLEQHQSFWCFSGKVVSARCGCSNLSPTTTASVVRPQGWQCLFIDDSPANVAAAEALGSRAAIFTHPAWCRRI